MIEVNLLGLLYVSKAGCTTCRRREAEPAGSRPGNISSVAGRVARSAAASQRHQARGGAFSESLRQEVTAATSASADRARPVATELVSHNRPEVQEQLKALGEIERLAADDIADAISYVVSRATSDQRGADPPDRAGGLAVALHDVPSATSSSSCRCCLEPGPESAALPARTIGQAGADLFERPVARSARRAPPPRRRRAPAGPTSRIPGCAIAARISGSVIVRRAVVAGALPVRSAAVTSRTVVEQLEGEPDLGAEAPQALVVEPQQAGAFEQLRGLQRQRCR